LSGVLALLTFTHANTNKISTLLQKRRIMLCLKPIWYIIG
jgi:hypothetical protein